MVPGSNDGDPIPSLGSASTFEVSRSTDDEGGSVEITKRGVVNKA